MMVYKCCIVKFHSNYTIEEGTTVFKKKKKKKKKKTYRKDG